MPTIAFTSHLHRWAPPAALQVEAGTARQALAVVLGDYPSLRSYVLDEHGELRRHVALFINGQLVRGGFDRPLAAEDRIDIMQALSGG